MHRLIEIGFVPVGKWKRLDPLSVEVGASGESFLIQTPHPLSAVFTLGNNSNPVAPRRSTANAGDGPSESVPKRTGLSQNEINLDPLRLLPQNPLLAKGASLGGSD